MLIQTRVTEAPTDDDKLAMESQISDYNERLLAADPEASPLPTSTNVELRQSYAFVLNEILQRAHESYVDQAKRAIVEDIKGLVDQFDTADLDQLKTVVQRLKDRKANR